MEPPIIASIVERHGEVEAILPLIQRIIESTDGVVYPRVMRPYRQPWGTLVNRRDNLERCAEIVLREGGPASRLLVLLDADDYCPATLGPQLLQRLILRFPENRISVSLANWEFESWFVASAESIAHHLGKVVEVTVPENIEDIQDPKGWLERHVLNRRYGETSDQSSFSSLIDVPLARQRSQSFDRFCRELERLLN